MNNFETAPLQGNKSITPDAKIKNSGIKTAQGVFEMYKEKNDRIKMEDFMDVYGEDEIKKDMERVEYVKKSKGYEKPTPHGVALENMFCDLAEKHQWFGEGVKVVQLSEFDDVLASGAHCDAVLEIPVGENGYVVRIGVDLTTAINYDTLSKKRTKCIDAVQTGKFFNVKYFKSKIDSTKGKISDLPVFFAGINKETIDNLCVNVAKDENTGRTDLKKHEVQFMFLEEIMSQLNRYIGISMIKHGSEAGTTQWLEYYKKLFEWIGENKKSLRPNNFGQKALLDDVYKYITKFC